MFEYNDAVADSIATEIVGGSQECLNVVVEGHKTIKNMLASTDGRRNLESMFNVCVPGSLDDEKNQEQFAGDGVIYLPAQSNDPACTTQYCNIEKICVLLTDNTIGTPLDRLVTLAKAQQGSSCNLVSYDAMLKTLSNPKNPERSWLYQTCTEWGFYQTCMEGSGCPYTQGLHTLDVDYDICLNAFSIDAATVAQQIQSTLSRYGGNYIQSSRILFPNGQIDPWYTLGVLTAPNDKEPVLWVEGASHHFWTHPSLPTDSDFVKDARVTIWNQVDQWLEEN